MDGLDSGGHGPRVGGVRSLVLVYAAIIGVCLLMLSPSKKKKTVALASGMAHDRSFHPGPSTMQGVRGQVFFLDF